MMMISRNDACEVQAEEGMHDGDDGRNAAYELQAKQGYAP